MTITSFPLLLTLDEAAKLLGVKSRGTVLEYVKRGELESVHLGRLHRVRPESLAEFAKRLEDRQQRRPSSLAEEMKAAGRAAADRVRDAKEGRRR